MKNNLILVLGIALIFSAAIGYYMPIKKYFKLNDSGMVELSKETYDNLVYKYKSSNGENNPDIVNRYKEQNDINIPLMLLSFFGLTGGGLLINLIVTIIIKKRKISSEPVNEKAIYQGVKFPPNWTGLDQDLKERNKEDELSIIPQGSDSICSPELRVKEDKSEDKIERVKKYNKVGGWLLLLCIALTIGTPLRSLYGISVSYDNMIQLQKTFPRLESIFYISSIIISAVMVLSVIVGMMLWDLKKDSVRMTKIYLIIFFAAIVIINLITFIAGLPSEVSQAMIPSVLSGILQALVYSGVWYWYLSVSKRVKATLRINS